MPGDAVPSGNQMNFHELKAIARLLLKSLNLDAILKLLVRIEGYRDLGKSQTEISSLKVVCG